MDIRKQRSIAFILGKQQGRSPEESQAALLSVGWPGAGRGRQGIPLALIPAAEKAARHGCLVLADNLEAI